MPRKYSGTGNIAVGSTKTLAAIAPTTAVRPGISDIIVGCASTPADQATKFQFMRGATAGSTVGASTTFVPMPLDPGDPAASATFGYNFSTEPNGLSATPLLTISLNQRATFRWVAAPGYELRLAASTISLGVFQSASGTGTAIHDCTLIWEE